MKERIEKFNINGNEIMEATKDALIWGWDESADGVPAEFAVRFMARMAEIVGDIVYARNELREAKKLARINPTDSMRKAMNLAEWVRRNRERNAKQA